MEIFCPECMGTLVSTDGKTLVCPLEHKKFEVLFLRVPPQAAMKEVMKPDTNQKCASHPDVQASLLCTGCGTPLCTTCVFPQADGASLCMKCAAQKTQTGVISSGAATPLMVNMETPPVIPAGQMCVSHPGIPAVQICKVCGRYMCQTCDFVFSGNIHLCPTCATAPQEGVKGKRKTCLIWAYILAVWSSLALVFFLIGLASMANSPEEQAMLDIVVSFFILIPSLIGTALGCSVIDRRLINPLSVWVAAIWNGVIVGGIILLCIIGIFIS